MLPGYWKENEAADCENRLRVWSPRQVEISFPERFSYLIKRKRNKKEEEWSHIIVLHICMWRWNKLLCAQFMCSGESVILDTQQTVVCSPCWLGTITPEQLFILEARWRTATVMMFQDRPVHYSLTICCRTIVCLFFFSLLMFFVVLDKEKQTMTPGSVFGSWESHADCTSKRRIRSDGGASRTVRSYRTNASRNRCKVKAWPEV